VVGPGNWLSNPSGGQSQASSTIRSRSTFEPPQSLWKRAVTDILLSSGCSAGSVVVVVSGSLIELAAACRHLIQECGCLAVDKVDIRRKGAARRRMASD